MRFYQSLHFVVYGYDMNKNMNIAENAENVYKKVMFDMNLMSFKPRENYRITVYRTPEEFHQETSLPAWSGGVTVTKPLGEILPSERGIQSRVSIATYESGLTASQLAHEVTHLVFNEFMGASSPEKLSRLKWLNEGLATYEEMEFYNDGLKEDFIRLTRSIVKRNPVPINEMVSFLPIHVVPQNVGRFYFANQPNDYTNIDLWYWHTQFLAQFLIKKEGQFAFYTLLGALKNDRTFVDALQDAYPGKWRTLQELENEWRQWL